MRALAVSVVLLLGLVAGTWGGIWLNRRTNLSFLRDRGFSRETEWLIRGMLFLGVLSIVTVPFQILALAIE